MNHDDDNGNRRRWDKWNTLIQILIMLGGFLTTGAIYVRGEGERDAKINFLVNEVSDFSSTRYTKADAVKDAKIQEDHYNDLSERLKQLEYRFNRVEDKRPTR